MFFTSPIFLLTLVPWGAIALWLLWTRRTPINVPFLDLWRTAEPTKRTSRRFAPPPLPLAAALFAALLALLAAAGPRVHFAGAAERPLVTIILDRGITMSPLDRRAETIGSAAPMLLQQFGPGPVDVIDVPDGSIRRTDRSSWPAAAHSLRPTALDTTALLRGAVAQALARNDALVVVLTDRPIDASNPRVVQIAPKKPLRNVGIVNVAMRESPRPQAMVTIRNDSDETSAELLITSADQSSSQKVQLPQQNSEHNYFVDLSLSGPVVRASLQVHDDVPFDNQFWLTRQRSTPSLEIRGDAAPEIRRIADAYQKSHPPKRGAAAIPIITSPATLRDDEPGIVLIPPTGATTQPALSSSQIRAHPLTANVHWSDLKLVAANMSSRISASWTPLITEGGTKLLAVRDMPARQILVAFDTTVFADSPDFVIFWTNLFDYLAQSDTPTFTSSIVSTPLGEEWKPLETSDAKDASELGRLPGVFRRAGDGALRALNAAPVRIPAAAAAPDTAETHRKLAALAKQQTGGVDVAPPTLIAAISCLCVAISLWPRRNLTAFSAARTV